MKIPYLKKFKVDETVVEGGALKIVGLPAVDPVVIGVLIK